MLFNQDSNLDKQDQNLLCYHYTIEQCLRSQERSPLPSFASAKIRALFHTGKYSRFFFEIYKNYTPKFSR